MSQSRGRPFAPGNKFGRGRPKGSCNKSTSAARQLLEQHQESLMAQQLKAAYDGDAKARQWCLEQVLRNPAQAGKLKLPAMQTLDDLSKAYDAILLAVCKGERTAAEGVALMGMVEGKRKLIETQALTARIEQLGGSTAPRSELRGAAEFQRAPVAASGRALARKLRTSTRGGQRP